jgi:hypothetical protein
MKSGPSKCLHRMLIGGFERPALEIPIKSWKLVPVVSVQPQFHSGVAVRHDLRQGNLTGAPVVRAFVGSHHAADHLFDLGFSLLGIEAQDLWGFLGSEEDRNPKVEIPLGLETLEIWGYDRSIELVIDRKHNVMFFT